MMKFMLCAMLWIVLAFGLNTWVQFGFGTYDATLNSALQALDEARSNALAPLKPKEGVDESNGGVDNGEDEAEAGGEGLNHSVDLSQLQNMNLQGAIQDKMIAASLARKEYLYRLRMMWIILTFVPLFVGAVFVIRAQSGGSESGDEDGEFEVG